MLSRFVEVYVSLEEVSVYELSQEEEDVGEYCKFMILILDLHMRGEDKLDGVEEILEDKAGYFFEVLKQLTDS